MHTQAYGTLSMLRMSNCYDSWNMAGWNEGSDAGLRADLIMVFDLLDVAERTLTTHSGEQ